MWSIGDRLFGDTPPVGTELGENHRGASYVCAADDAEARLSAGSWLLLTCDETRCGCVSPATLVLLMLFLGIHGFHRSPALHLHRFIYLNSTFVQPLSQPSVQLT